MTRSRRRMPLWLAVAAGGALVALAALRPPVPRAAEGDSAASSPPAAETAPGRLRSPKPPEHRTRNLTTPSELARDLFDTVAYLDSGQAYFRAYRSGSHTVEENAAFLRFLEDYEKELVVARKEADALRAWIKEKGSLDTVSVP